MAFYSVRVLIRCTGKRQPTRLPLYEDRIVIVRATDHKAAQRKARKVIARREVPYKNALGNLVSWRVEAVCQSVELFDDEFKNGKPNDGAQVYWRYIRSSNPVRRLRREGLMNSIY